MFIKQGLPPEVVNAMKKKMGLDEKLKGMDIPQLEKYKKKEKVKAIVGTIVSVIPVTAALGFVAGGFIGYELLPYIDTSGMSPEGGYGMAMLTVAAPAVKAIAPGIDAPADGIAFAHSAAAIIFNSFARAFPIDSTIPTDIA